MLNVFALIISIIAIVVSILSAIISYSSSRDTAKSQVIQQSYEAFHQLTHLHLENWQSSHMFALPQQYDGVFKLVEASLINLDPVKQAEMILKERAIADIIFNVFERTFYQWNHAKGVGDSKRASFLLEALDYLTGRLLRNPRLLYYWSDTGGGLASSYEHETRKYYETNVLHNPQSPLQQKADTIGPLAIK